MTGEKTRLSRKEKKGLFMGFLRSKKPKPEKEVENHGFMKKTVGETGKKTTIPKPPVGQPKKGKRSIFGFLKRKEKPRPLEITRIPQKRSEGNFWEDKKLFTEGNNVVPKERAKETRGDAYEEPLFEEGLLDRTGREIEVDIEDIGKPRKESTEEIRRKELEKKKRPIF